MNALYRSQIEICRLLEELAKHRGSLFMEFDSRTVESHMLLVDPGNACFVCAYGVNKKLNSRLFKAPVVKVTAHLQDADLVFEVAKPDETWFEGQPAMSFSLPISLIRYHGRAQPRISVSGEASMRCIADTEGILPFEAHIIDISQDGLGALVFDREVKLEPGAVLKRCRIIIPGGRAVVADLGVRYMTAVTLPDGSLAFRAGFRFIQRPDEIPDLITFFNQHFD